MYRLNRYYFAFNYVIMFKIKTLV